MALKEEAKFKIGDRPVVRLNYFTDVFIAIMEECLEGDIFHIVSNEPKTLDDIAIHTGHPAV